MNAFYVRALATEQGPVAWFEDDPVSEREARDLAARLESKPDLSRIEVVEAQPRTFAVLYSYPTWDRHYRGQRGLRVEAVSVDHALQLIREGKTSYGYPACPGARIVRAKAV